MYNFEKKNKLVIHVLMQEVVLNMTKFVFKKIYSVGRFVTRGKMFF
jgi:hypothetical protein